MNDHQINDNLKRIFRKSGAVSPPPDFTHNVMRAVNRVFVLTDSVENKRDKLTDRIILIASAIVGSAAIVWYFFSYSKPLLASSFDPVFWPLFQKITENLSELLLSFRVSSITVVVILAIILVLLADVLIRKMQTRRKSFLFL